MFSDGLRKPMKVPFNPPKGVLTHRLKTDDLVDPRGIYSLNGTHVVLCHVI